MKECEIKIDGYIDGYYGPHCAIPVTCLTKDLVAFGQWNDVVFMKVKIDKRKLLSAAQKAWKKYGYTCKVKF